MNNSKLLNKQIIIFYSLALLLGGLVSFLVVKNVLPTGLIFLAAASASISGIITTAIFDGKDGVKKLFGRLLIWRAKARYWLFALFFLGIAVPLGALMNPFVGGDAMDLSKMHQSILMIVPMFAMFMITAGLGEEIGWRGFLLPRLQARYSALKSSIIVGLMWGFWHTPLFLLSGLDHPILAEFPYAGWVSQYGFIIALFTFVLINQIPWSIFYTWIFNNSRGSLLLIAFMHASEVWVAYWQVNMGIDAKNFNNYWGYGLVMIVTSVILISMYGAKNLSYKNKRIIYEG